MLDDLRTALRWLRRDPAVTLVVALTMALAIGANTAIYSALQGVLLRPFRFEGGDRTVLVWRAMRQGDVRVSPSPAQLEAWREAPVFEAFETFTMEEMAWTASGPARTLRIARISPTLPATVGAQPILGRGLTAADAEAGADPVVLITTALWNARFGGTRDALGRTMTLDGIAHTIVGVLPRDFVIPSPLPYEWDAVRPLPPSDVVYGRSAAAVLREGVTIEQAEAVLDALPVEGDVGEQWKPSLLPPSALGRSLRPSLILLSAAVGLLLLIACINVANVLLVRAHARQREVAVQAALGASRGRVFRQALLGALALALLGGAGGLLLASWLADTLPALRPDELSLLDRVTIDGRVLAFAALASLGAGVMFGLTPALQAMRHDTLDALRSGVRVDSSRAGRRFRLVLVVAEVALSFVLLAGAALLVRSVAAMNRVEPGFQAAGLATLRVSAPDWKYQDVSRRAAYFERVREAASAVRGAESVSIAGGAPPRTGIYFGTIEIAGRPAPDLDGQSVLFGVSADDRYFATLRQPVIEGRTFQIQDLPPPGVGSDEIVSTTPWILGESTARRIFGAESAVGQRMRLDAESEWHTIIGVVADTKPTGLGDDEEHLQMYTPWSADYSEVVLLVRTTGDAAALLPALERAVSSIDTDVAVGRSATMTQLLAESIGRQRFVARLLLGFALLAATLAGIGIYGVLAHIVRLRRREIGIRMALGARPAEILRMVVRQGGGATLAGIVIGVPVALIASRLITSLLFGVSGADPASYVAAAALLATIALTATLIPARRAAAVAPTEAMRHD